MGSRGETIKYFTRKTDETKLKVLKTVRTTVLFDRNEISKTETAANDRQLQISLCGKKVYERRPVIDIASVS